MSKEIITALAAASKAVKSLPPAPVFDREAVRSFLASQGLSDPFLSRAVDEMARKHTEQHGDTGERLIATVLAELADAVGGIESLSTVANRMAKVVRIEGKTVVTGSQWRAALEGKPEQPEHAKLASEAAKLRSTPVPTPWSEIRDKLNLTDAARAQLYNLISNDKGMEKAFKALADV